MAYLVMAVPYMYMVIGCLVMACIIMAFSVMACIVMACIVMVCIVMAYKDTYRPPATANLGLEPGER